MKAIETNYKGIRFRSKLEAQWAVFFDECDIKWEYEPQGFKLDNGLWYLPDFLLHDVRYHNNYIDLYVEVKGVLNDKDKAKLLSFSESAPIILLGSIPWGNTCEEMIEDIKQKYNNTYFFNSYTIDGFNEFCILGMVNAGWCIESGIIKYESDFMKQDFENEQAYYNARNYRFDHRSESY